MSRDKAAEAREGLFDSIAGKAKEVAGALSGKDALVEEGQLQQAEAAHRKTALADDAIADAKREEAAQQFRDATRDAAEDKGAARAQAHREDSTIERQREDEHVAATQNAEQQEAADRRAAEQRADELAESRLREAGAMAADATSTEQQATSEQRRLQRQAAVAEQEAAQLRADTQK